ncbi:MAG: chemotaxis protein CheW [Myxococcota bacterium]
MIDQSVLSRVGKWSTFFLNGEMLAVRVEDVQEILMAQPLTQVPLSGAHVLGLLNLRGHVMPVLDLRPRLGLAGSANPSEGKLLVVASDTEPYALLVDDIGDVIHLDDKGWLPVPSTLGVKERAHVFGIHPIQSRIVLGLRLADLWSDEKRE